MSLLSRIATPNAFELDGQSLSHAPETKRIIVFRVPAAPLSHPLFIRRNHAQRTARRRSSGVFDQLSESWSTSAVTARSEFSSVVPCRCRRLGRFEIAKLATRRQVEINRKTRDTKTGFAERAQKMRGITQKDERGEVLCERCAGKTIHEGLDRAKRLVDRLPNSSENDAELGRYGCDQRRVNVEAARDRAETTLARGCRLAHHRGRCGESRRARRGRRRECVGRRWRRGTGRWRESSTVLVHFDD